MNVETFAARADLTAVQVTREHGGFHRFVHATIFEQNEGGLAAQFQTDRNQALRALAENLLARGGTARHGDQTCDLVCHQFATHRGTAAGH